MQALSAAQINFAWIFLASLWQPRGFNIVVVQKVMTAIKRFNETPGKLNPYDHFFPCCLAKRTLMLSPVEVILDSLVDKPESKSQVRSPKRKESEDFELWLSLKSYVKSCQKLSKVVKSCQELSRVVKSCQKLSKVIISYHKLSEAVIICHKLS